MIRAMLLFSSASKIGYSLTELNSSGLTRICATSRPAEFASLFRSSIDQSEGTD